MTKQMPAAPLLALLLASLATSTLAARGPSTPDERAAMATKMRAAESLPLDKSSAQARTELFKWVAEVPDVNVKWCAGLLLEAGESNKELAGALLVQAMLSAAAFTLENPNAGTDTLLVSRAGIRGALKAYRATIVAKPKKAVPFLDNLAKRDEAGTLDEYISPKLARVFTVLCG